MVETTDGTSVPGGNGVEAVGEAGVDPAPVIVIEYRHRGLASRLMPPALILLAALAISSYQRRTPIRPIAPRTGPAPSSEGKASNPGPEAPAPKVVFRSEPEPARPKESPREEPRGAVSEVVKSAPLAAAPIADTPAPPARVATNQPAPSPFDLEPVEGLQPLPVVEQTVPPPQQPVEDPVAASPAPQPTEAAPEPAAVGAAPGTDQSVREATTEKAHDAVSKEDVLRDIQREADHAAARQEEMERMKPRARALLAAEAVARIQESRAPFRNDLRQLLKTHGDDAGEAIDSLCEEYWVETLPEAKAAFSRALKLRVRVSNLESVELMRGLGVPEPAILEYLAHGLHKKIHTRGGPRDETEVRVLAARLLLTIPLANPRKPALPPSDPRPSASGVLSVPTRPPAASPRAFPR